MSESPPRVRLVRAASFSAAHRYFDPKLSAEANRDLYGSLYREKGFGHNFRLEAHFEGEVNPLNGMIINLKHVDGWLKALIDRLDHRHLNELPEFAGQTPTPERIADFCFEALAQSLAAYERDGKPGDGTQCAPGKSSVRLVKVRLFEGETLWVDRLA